MDLAETLRSSIDVRREALAAQVEALRGSVADEKSAVVAVLELFAFFPTALKEVVEAEWTRNVSPLSRVQLLRPLLRHTIWVSSFVESWLAHLTTASAPLHLLAELERASVEMGLGDRRAIVAVGPANNFITVVREMDEVLFHPLGPLSPPRPATVVGPFILMQAPRIEGSSPRFHPVILGHELAHIAITVKNLLATLDIGGGLDLTRARSIAVPGVVSPGPAGAIKLGEVAENWAEELICDAYAVRRFGVSAVAALGDFLEAVGATDLPSETHPPGRLRLHLLVEWLGAIASPRISLLAQPWRELVAQPMSYSEQ